MSWVLTTGLHCFFFSSSQKKACELGDGSGEAGKDCQWKIISLKYYNMNSSYDLEARNTHIRCLTFRSQQTAERVGTVPCTGHGIGDVPAVSSCKGTEGQRFRTHELDSVGFYRVNEHDSSWMNGHGCDLCLQNQMLVWNWLVSRVFQPLGERGRAGGAGVIFPY